ncbi:Serine/threonine-protein kinase STE20 [Lachnellula suecica]|uniref:Serine/threonine-protein kinase STE20 n=1 Tax=Lachnellula suecica TaxID=602035 RepID=A0A8T9BZI4_9HELO|nr:Serine/threonine-protein kinase STE20 [Lachnellula suecica]
MAMLLNLKQTVKGTKSTYTILKELHRATDEGAVYLAQNQETENYVVKSIRSHWRLQNEAKILKLYQSKTPFIRPVVDEIVDPSDPPSIVLRYLDSQLLTESRKWRLTRPEIKQVAKCILKALQPLHKDKIVHTDIKLDNIFVNFGKDGQRFSEIQLGDFGGAVSEASSFAKDGRIIGAGYTRSPEAALQISWGTPTDIWSFGNVILSLIHGGDYHQFDPHWDGLKPDHDDYEYTVLKRMYNSCGPFPLKMAEIINNDALLLLHHFNEQAPPQKPLTRWSTNEIPPADNAFIRKILKLDPRDRPTVDEILADKWFTENSEDTRAPLPPDPWAKSDDTVSA